ncbi:hypothetical protein ACFQ36_13970 [Arthrobacter sp. GCM10027362]|uniref:hypothetical protein n=1 Tax=Arthrobacter sp. GCM10027362 TaxID=3273379 RepID=UPI0036412315
MRTTGRGQRLRLVAAAWAAGLMVAVAGCSEPPAEATSVAESATKEEIAGTGLHKMTLTAKAMERLDLATAKVAGGRGGLQVPYGALIYDAEGRTWVYTNPEPRVFVRAEVIVDRIEGDVVRLRKGPAAGTAIVTVGAAELFGAEFDAAH